jgi:hypothetical protein
MYGDEPGGKLTLLVIASNAAGYAPSCRVQTATGSGTTWTLHCDAAFYGDGSIADAAWFATGYRIQLEEFDNETPVSLLGTVTSVVGNDIAVTLDSPWSGIGSALWYDLDFAPSTEGITAAQKAFCYMADPTGAIAYNDGTSDRYRVFV